MNPAGAGHAARPGFVFLGPSTVASSGLQADESRVQSREWSGPEACGNERSQAPACNHGFPSREREGPNVVPSSATHMSHARLAKFGADARRTVDKKNEPERGAPGRRPGGSPGAETREENRFPLALARGVLHCATLPRIRRREWSGPKACGHERMQRGIKARRSSGSAATGRGEGFRRRPSRGNQARAIGESGGRALFRRSPAQGAEHCVHRRVAAPCGHDGSFRGDHIDGAAHDSPEAAAVDAGDAPARVDQKREGKGELFGEAGMAGRRSGVDAVHDGVGGLEFGVAIRNPAELAGSTGGVVARVEHKNDGAAAKPGKAHEVGAMVGRGEIRRGSSGREKGAEHDLVGVIH